MKQIYAITLLIICLALNLFAQQPQTGPQNPYFLEYNKNREKDHQRIKTLSGHYLGYIPEPVLPNTTINPALKKQIASLPSSYDLRSLGKVSSVKDQGSCGDCWTFATMAVLESRWMILGYGEKDLSENNLKECHGFYYSACDGGNAGMSLAYLSRDKGPLYESDDPYVTSVVGCTTGKTPAAYVTDGRYLPSDIPTIKQAILDYGAMYTAFYWADANYNASTYTYYYPNQSNSTNHAVTIVGWDDNKVTAGGTGAWIIKNSWGASWGDKGYFYISYNDAWINSNICYFPSRIDYNPNQILYYYDELGWIWSYGWTDGTASGLVKFTASSNQSITKISTYVNTSSTTVDFDIFGNFDGTNLTNLLGSLKNQACLYAGYYTFNLTTPISIKSGNNFYVRAKYTSTTSGAKYLLSAEGESDNYAYPTIESGKCWCSHDGVSYWNALGSNTSSPYDLCIRAYAIPDNTSTAVTNNATGITSSGAILNGTVNPNGSSTTVTFQYGLTSSYGSTVTATQSPVSGSSSTAVSASITGLTQGTIYHFRVVAVNAGGTTNGSDQTFTTATAGPTATTSAATSVASTSATINGSVNPNSLSTTVTFNYGLTTSYGSTVTAAQSPVSGSSIVPVSANLSGLIPGSTYHFRVNATNTGGTSSGTDQTFTTTAVPPTVTINSASAITAARATLNGIVNPNYSSTTVTFEYGLSTSYGTSVTADQSPVSGSTNVTVSKTLTGLTPNTVYHYRIDAINAGGTTRSPDSTFQTLPLVPTNIALTSGNNQSQKINTALNNSFVVTITDISGIPVPGVTVIFTIATVPAGASGQSLSTTTTTTNANGQASTILTLGNKIGSYTVTAVSTGLTGSPITFSSTATAGSAALLTYVSGNNQSGGTSSVLTLPVTVAIYDLGGNPVSGVTVSFSVTTAPTGATGQSLTVTSATTDAYGQAQSYIRLGNKPGTYLFSASSSGLSGSPIVFTAIANSGTPSVISYLSGGQQSAQIKTALPIPFGVTVADQGGNPVQGISVSFAIASSPDGATGQSLSTSAAITDSNGRASSILTFGSKIGTYAVTASVSGLTNSPITFNATATAGPAANITITSGNNQNVQAGSNTSNPLVVTVLDAGGNPIANISVVFSISGVPTGAIGQILSATNILTNSSGIASTILTLGNKTGIYTVTASVSGLSSPITFTITAISGSAKTISMTSGNNQSGMINTVLANPFIITVTDINSNPVSGVPVAFSITSSPSGAGGYSISAANSITDVNGQASTILTLGDKSGTYTISVTSSGLTGSPLTFTATAQIGGPSRIALTSGNNQSGQINAQLSSPLIVTITDAGGNPTPGITVLYTIVNVPSGAVGQILSASTVSTNQDGQASVMITLGNKTGAYTAAASAVGLYGSPITFSATAIPGNPVTLSMVSGNNQSAQINSSLSNPFTVSVVDAGSNPVSGAAVTFAITTVPAGAGGQLLSVTGTTTNSSGQASSILTLGNKEGAYNVTATSTGLAGSPILFSALGTPIVGIAGTDNLSDYHLGQNYPNPFNPTTRIEYSIQENSHVSIKVFNALGIEIGTLVNKYQSAGKYSLEWDPGDNPGGLYFYVLKTAKYFEMRKMLYLK